MPVVDPQAEALRSTVSAVPLAEAVRLVLDHLQVDDADVRQVVLDQALELDGLASTTTA